MIETTLCLSLFALSSIPVAVFLMWRFATKGKRGKKKKITKPMKKTLYSPTHE